MTDNTWILHDHDYASCGCGVIYSIYQNSDLNTYTDGSDHITVLRCKDHPSTRSKIDHMENAEPEPEMEWI